MAGKGASKKLKKILVDFSEETTFHGIRYVADKTSHFSRRLLWALVTLAALAGFLYFVITQILSLSSHPKAVNVEIIYTQELPFPAVTLCNQNTFRASKAFKIGVYDVIEDTFNNSIHKYSSPTDGCQEDDFDIQRGIVMFGRRTTRYRKITKKLCRMLCVKYHGNTCNSFMYDNYMKYCDIFTLIPENALIRKVFHGESDVYVRKRCPVSIVCDFEGGRPCPLYEDKQYSGDVWRRGTPETFKRGPNRDHTKIYGSYLYLDDTALANPLSPPYLFTPYLQAQQPLCMDISYSFSNATLESSRYSLSVNLVDSSENIITTHRLTVTKGQLWNRQFLYLGTGLYQVHVKPGINNLNSKGHVALDDVKIDRCETLTLGYRECRMTVLGTEYLGNISLASDGFPCLPWSDPSIRSFTADSDFLEGSVDGAASYCRNPDDNPNGPWCFTRGNSVFPETSGCSIPYCECRDDQFRCKSGQCVPLIAICDGTYDCFDLSDEINTCIKEVDCNFESPKICGYEGGSRKKTQWQRHQGRMRNGRLTLDHTTQTAKGHYLYLDSGTITRTERERISISTPMHISSNDIPECLEFHAYTAKDTFFPESMGEIIVYKYTGKYLRQRLVRVSGTSDLSDIWRYYSRNMTVNEVVAYWIVFEAVLGEPYLSDMAIDDVKLRHDCENQDTRLCWPDEVLCDSGSECVSMTSLCDGVVHCQDFSDEDGAVCDPKRRFDCDFSESFICGYIDYSNPDMEGWQFTQERDGSFVSITASSVSELQRKILSSAWLMLAGPSCLQIDHNMAISSGICSLSVYQLHPDSQTLLDIVSGDAEQLRAGSNYWRSTFVSLLSLNNLTRLQFVFNCTGEVDDYRIKLNNVNISHETCVEKFKDGGLDCEFYSGEVCNYLDVSRSFASWLLHDRGLRTHLPLGGPIRRGEALVLSPTLTSELYHCVTLNLTKIRTSGRDPIKLNVYNASYGIDEQRWTNRELASGLEPNNTDVNEGESSLLLWAENVYSGEVGEALVKFQVSPGSYRLLVSAGLYEDSGLTISAIKAEPGQCEVPGACPGYVCSGKFYKCLDRFLLCDGKRDCWLGDDELPPYCPGPVGDRNRGDYDMRGHHGVPGAPGDPGAVDTIFEDEDRTLEDTYRDADDLTSMFYELGHQVEDLIHGCSWGGSPCSGENFTTQITDYGLCHTFNIGTFNNTLLTARTGASSGLRLLLNIEQYEYMKGPHGDAGMKIFLHDQQEVPFVRDLGFSVGPGSHALVAVKLTQTESLGPPWGSCGTATLNYTNTYTFSSCVRECETQAMLQMCGCRDSYMPGFNEFNPPICNVSKYLNCALTIERTGFADISFSDCGCIEPCFRKVYESQLSYGAISSLNIGQLVQGNLDHLLTKYLDIQETNYRSNSDTFLEDLDKLSALDVAYKDILAFTRNRIWSPVGSQIMRMHLVMQSFLDHVLSADLSNTLLWKVEDLYNAFDYFYGLNIRSLKGMLQGFLISLRLLHQLSTMPQPSANSTMEEILLRNQILALKEGYFHLNHTIAAIMSGVDEGSDMHLLLPQKLFSNECEGRLLNLRHGFDIIQQQFDSVEFKTNQEFVTNIIRLEMTTRQFLPCTEEYTNLLETIASWKQNFADAILRVNTMLMSFNKKGSIDNILDYYDTSLPLMNFQEKVAKNLKSFRTAYLTWEDLNNFLSLEEQTKTLEEVDYFVSSITSSFVDPIKQHLIQLQTLAEDTYLTLANVEIKLAFFLGNNYKSSTFKSLKIFYYPKANVEIPEIVIFDEDKFPMGSVKQFLASNPSRVLEELVVWHNKPIHQAVSELTQALMRKRAHIKGLLSRAGDQYKKYIQQTRLDDEFFKKNFIAVDIYFAQLKYQDVKQIRTYTIDLFLSDVGGYLGLLLGGSVISLFEFFDLVLYKFYKWKRSQVTEETEMENQKSADKT